MAIPIVAMLLVIFPAGPVGAPAGLLLAVIGLLLAYGQPPSRKRTNLLICSVMAGIGTGIATVLFLVHWLG